MTDDYRTEEAQLALALRHISVKTSYNLAEVARLYNVNCQKLRQRVASR